MQNDLELICSSGIGLTFEEWKTIPHLPVFLFELILLSLLGWSLYKIAAEQQHEVAWDMNLRMIGEQDNKHRRCGLVINYIKGLV
jgi:hypothetical protein